LGGLAEGLEPLEGAWIAARKDRLHRQNGMLFYLYAIEGITFPPCQASKKSTFHPSNRFEEFGLTNDDSNWAKAMSFYLYADM